MIGGDYRRICKGQGRAADCKGSDRMMPHRYGRVTQPGHLAVMWAIVGSPNNSIGTKEPHRLTRVENPYSFT